MTSDPDRERERERSELITNCRKYIESFLRIRDKSGAVIPFRLNAPQIRLYDEIKRQSELGKPVRIIILKARQMGFSTMTEGVIFKQTATHFGYQSLIVAHKEDSASQLFDMSKRFYDNLPPELRPLRRASNAQELVFDTPSRSRDDRKGLGSSIRCATAGGQGIGRSYTLNALHLSEFAFWSGDKMSTYTGLAQAVPDKPGTLIIIESTANGYDEFKTLWDNAVEAQRIGADGFVPIFFAWHEMAEYRRAVPPGFTRTDEEQALVDTYGLDDEQLSWRRWCILNNCGGDLDLFHQEYPASPDEAFISTGRCAFDQNKIVLRRKQVQSQSWEIGQFSIQQDVAEKIASYQWRADKKGFIRILRQPEEGVPYVIGADTAGTGSDFFAAHVLDNRTGEQVAVLHHRFGEREFSRQLYCLGKYYNDALIGIETNYSTYPELCLEDLGYTKLYVRERVDTFTGQVQNAFGFATTTKTRPLIIDGLKDVAANEIQLINDFQTLGEMLTFVYDENWKPQAEAGQHDDLVMSLAIAHYIRPQQDVSAKRKENAPDTRNWTADMWQDYNNANEDIRRLLIAEWGRPN